MILGCNPAMARAVPARHNLGQPIVPERDLGIGQPWSDSDLPGDHHELPQHEQGYLATQIRLTVERIQNQPTVSTLPVMQSLAIPAGPAVPQLPKTVPEIRAFS